MGTCLTINTGSEVNQIIQVLEEFVPAVGCSQFLPAVFALFFLMPDHSMFFLVG